MLKSTFVWVHHAPLPPPPPHPDAQRSSPRAGRLLCCGWRDNNHFLHLFRMPQNKTREQKVWVTVPAPFLRCRARGDTDYCAVCHIIIAWKIIDFRGQRKTSGYGYHGYEVQEYGVSFRHSRTGGILSSYCFTAAAAVPYRPTPGTVLPPDEAFHFKCENLRTYVPVYTRYVGYTWCQV